MMSSARPWDLFEGTAVDASGSSEVTRITMIAHGWILDTARRQLEPGWRYARGGSRLRLFTPRGYVVECRGQSSAAAHGKQGAHPSHLAELRELAFPVLLVFRDGGWAQSVWLDDPSAPIVNIDNDTAHRRQGWRVGDMDRVEAHAFAFPEQAPSFERGGLF